MAAETKDETAKAAKNKAAGGARDTRDTRDAKANSTAAEDVNEKADGAAAADDVDDAAEDAQAESAANAAPDSADADADAAAKAAAEAAEWKDKYMRLHAEWDTYRRRTKEQREEEKARAAEKLVTSLLPVLDDLERTIDYAEKNGDAQANDGLLSGARAVLAKFVDTLQKDGVEVLDPQGQAFDALEAQAVGTVEDADQPDETVAQVYQKGYKMGAKVLRPAMVTVTTGGPKREKPAPDDGDDNKEENES